MRAGSAHSSQQNQTNGPTYCDKCGTHPMQDSTCVSDVLFEGVGGNEGSGHIRTRGRELPFMCHFIGRDPGPTKFINSYSQFSVN